MELTININPSGLLFIAFGLVGFLVTLSFRNKYLDNDPIILNLWCWAVVIIIGLFVTF